MSHKVYIKILDCGNFADWDIFVANSPQGDVFCYSWWLNAVTNSNFKIIVALKNEEIVAGIPLPFDNNNLIYEPPLTRTLGILFKSQESLSGEYRQISNERKWMNALVDDIPHERFIQMCFHHNFKDWLPFKWKGYNQTTRYTYIIDYRNKSEGDLYLGMSHGIRKNLRKALDNGINVEQSQDLRLLYDLVCKSYERQNLKLNIPYDYIRKIDDSIQKNGTRVIFRAHDNSNQTHAMIYTVYEKRSVYQLLSGSDYHFRKLGGHTLARWEAIKYFSDKADKFNLGGSNIQNIEEHVRSYGGSLTPYFLIYNNQLTGKNNGIRYHMSEIKFHLKKIFKDLNDSVIRKN